MFIFKNRYGFQLFVLVFQGDKPEFDYFVKFGFQDVLSGEGENVMRCVFFLPVALRNSHNAVAASVKFGEIFEQQVAVVLKAELIKNHVFPGLVLPEGKAFFKIKIIYIIDACDSVRGLRL